MNEEAPTMIEFQYFEGCPNSSKTLDNLRAFLKNANLPENQVIMTLVENETMAQQLNFQGSPTILIDGMDIYTEKKPDSSNFSCRIYTLNNRKTGILPVEYIQRQYEKLARKGSSIA